MPNTLKTNRDKLVMYSLQGKVRHPAGGDYRISHDHIPRILPGTGGITYNFKIGDSCMGLVGDHVEPGVTIKNPDDRENAGLNCFSCVGNEATVITGDAKGAKGFVTGTHGGAEHVMIYLPKEALEKMTCDDKILVKGYGQGLSIENFPTVKVLSVDPDLFEKLNIVEKDGKLVIDVVTEVPAYMMGSGIGSRSAYQGDYDIMTADWDEVVKHGVDKLRFGDIVLLKDCDTSQGRGYLGGSVTIGIVIHSDSTHMGHGPGITSLFTCKTSLIEGNINPKANLADIMGV